MGSKLLPLATLLASLLVGGAPAQGRNASAIFAGGCFWCMEQPFDVLPGVVSTTSGYTGGKLADPSYEQVTGGNSGHAEAVRVVYDRSRVSYQALLEVFWRNIDPTVKDRQFCDRGSQYRSAIFTSTPEEHRLAEASRNHVAEQLGVPVFTEVVGAGRFYPAEDYHQDYYRKNPIRYAWYRRGCGRDARLREIWGTEALEH